MKVLKSEFERRLYRLQRAIANALLFHKFGDLFPALFSVYSYIWCNPSVYRHPSGELRSDDPHNGVRKDEHT